MASSDLNGKVVLITGASTGIGAAAALAFARAGSKVVVHYNTSRDAAESVVAQAREAGATAHAVAGDVTRSDEVARIEPLPKPARTPLGGWRAAPGVVI
jgi:3-oxoacyl-[acyl-carrier protein] reductase